MKTLLLVAVLVFSKDMYSDSVSAASLQNRPVSFASVNWDKLIADVIKAPILKFCP